MKVCAYFLTLCIVHKDLNNLKNIISIIPVWRGSVSINMTMTECMTNYGYQSLALSVI